MVTCLEQHHTFFRALADRRFSVLGVQCPYGHSLQITLAISCNSYTSEIKYLQDGRFQLQREGCPVHPGTEEEERENHWGKTPWCHTYSSWLQTSCNCQWSFSQSRLPSMTWTMRRPLSRVGRTVPSSKFSITGIYPKCYPSFSGAVPSSKQSITGISSFFFKINSIQEPLNLALLRGQAKARQRKEGCGEGRSGQSKGKVEGKGCKAWNPGYLGLRRRGWWEWWGGGGASAWWWGRWWRWIPPYYPGGHGGWWVGRGLGRGGDMGSVWRMQLWLSGWGARQLIHVNGCINVASKCHVWAFVFPNTIRLQLTGHQKWCRGLEQIDHLGRPSRCAKMRDACMLNHVRLRTAMFVQQTKKIGYRMVQVWLSSKHGSNCQASECVSPAHCQRDGGRPFQKAFRR